VLYFALLCFTFYFRSSFSHRHHPLPSSSSSSEKRESINVIVTLSLPREKVKYKKTVANISIYQGSSSSSHYHPFFSLADPDSITMIFQFSDVVSTLNNRYENFLPREGFLIIQACSGIF
jgi:hypothetical protein